MFVINLAYVQLLVWLITSTLQEVKYYFDINFCLVCVKTLPLLVKFFFSMSNPYEDVDECKCYVLFFSLIEFSNDHNILRSIMSD